MQMQTVKVKYLFMYQQLLILTIIVVIWCLFVPIKMPLFSKKTEKVTTLPQRKQRLTHVPYLNEDIDEFKKISVNLGNKEFKFIEGSWIAVNKGAGSVDDVTKLKHKITHLEEENNLNKIKVEVLLDMLAENMSAVGSNSHDKGKSVKN